MQVPVQSILHKCLPWMNASLYMEELPAISYISPQHDKVVFADIGERRRSGLMALHFRDLREAEILLLSWFTFKKLFPGCYKLPSSSAARMTETLYEYLSTLPPCTNLYQMTNVFQRLRPNCVHIFLWNMTQQSPVLWIEEFVLRSCHKPLCSVVLSTHS